MKVPIDIWEGVGKKDMGSGEGGMKTPDERLWTKERYATPVREDWGERYKELDIDVAPAATEEELLAQEASSEWDDTIDRYRSLHAVLEEAFERSAYGKGHIRHARGNEKFEDQYIIRGATSFGVGGLYFQVGKKLEESINLPVPQREQELLDCIVYCAAAIIHGRMKKK